ncbi:helix-turn-helix domain-containing protein [Acinetobacter johnsonii]|uniref:winged helix-turn-helix transcriptional regulator n=1 Tax=Acinetobacter johnsonii TaxID=40214 RepID=UPI0032B34B93
MGNYSPGCSVEAAIGLIDGKWKSIILWHLLEDDVLRFNELRKKIPNVTQKMLTRQFRELEEDQLILRKVYAVVPPKVEYRLSTLGTSLAPILVALKQWGDKNIGLFGKPIMPLESE